MKTILTISLAISCIISGFGQTGPVDFAQLKGILPIPVENYNAIKGCCIDQYNQSRTLTLADPFENQLRIACDSNTTAIAWAEGKVEKLLQSNSHWVVILSHNNFLTVYINLSNLQIEAGQDIKRLQPLGTVANVNGQYQLELELWHKESTGNSPTVEKLDPKEWIRVN